jgi:hypothetical protein
LKRLLYMFLVLVNSILLVAGVIGTMALATYLVLKELAVMRRTNCSPMHCPDGSTAEFPIYAGAIILVILALFILDVFYRGLRASLQAQRKAKQQRLTAASCREGDHADAPGVRHAWEQHGGEDRRNAPGGRVSSGPDTVVVVLYVLQVWGQEVRDVSMGGTLTSMVFVASVVTCPL